MAEDKEKEGQEPVKKKGKLPVILALVVVIAGGGFFMMKGKGAPPKVEVKPGPTIELEKEFLVNLSNGPSTYLRAEMALKMREGFTKEGLEESMPAIRDCINQILRSKSLQQVGSNGTVALQKEIASAINQILISEMKDEDKKKQKEFEKAIEEEKGDAHKKEKDKEKKAKHEGDEADEAEEYPCPAGPVLTVYFTSFTTQ